jgi:hypothetical protein
VTDPETPDEAYERLLRETRLGEYIGELLDGCCCI